MAEIDRELLPQEAELDDSPQRYGRPYPTSVNVMCYVFSSMHKVCTVSQVRCGVRRPQTSEDGRKRRGLLSIECGELFVPIG